MVKLKKIFLICNIILLFGANAVQAARLSKEEFKKNCNQECSVSPNRHKSNMKNDPRPTDQCALIRIYADMLYGEKKNKRGAELIFKDICPKSLDLVKMGLL